VIQPLESLEQGFSKVAFPRACGARRVKLLSFFASFQLAKKLNNLTLKDPLAGQREQTGKLSGAD
jgi:hypothetical protein